MIHLGLTILCIGVTWGFSPSHWELSYKSYSFAAENLPVKPQNFRAILNRKDGKDSQFFTVMGLLSKLCKLSVYPK